MIFFRGVAVLFLFFLAPLFVSGQENSNNNAPASGHSKQEAEKEKLSYRKQKKIHDKEVKDHHKRLQAKEVRKRMKKSQRKAKRNNDNKKEFFMVRWFSKKK